MCVRSFSRCAQGPCLMSDDVTAVFECTLHTALSQELEIASLSCIATMAWLWQNNDLWEPGRSHRLETHPVKEHSFVGNTACSPALHVRAKNTAIFQLYKSHPNIKIKISSAHCAPGWSSGWTPIPFPRCRSACRSS